MKKLSPEEIAHRRQAWEEESDKRMKLIQQAMSARSSRDMELFDKLNKELHDMVPNYCEHEIPWVEHCMACDDIAKQVFPEQWDACASCHELFDPDELIENDCPACYYEKHPEE